VIKKKENGKTKNVFDSHAVSFLIQTMHKHSKLDVAVKQQGFVIAHPRQFNLLSCDSKQIATEFA